MNNIQEVSRNEFKAAIEYGIRNITWRTNHLPDEVVEKLRAVGNTATFVVTGLYQTYWQGLKVCCPASLAFGDECTKNHPYAEALFEFAIAFDRKFGSNARFVQVVDE